MPSPSQIILKILAATLGLMGVAGLVMAVVSVPLIERNAEAVSTFHDASRFVDDFSANTNRLPRESELELWAQGQGPPANQVQVAQIDDLPPHTREAFGAAPSNGYVLSMWREDSMAYYASWSGDTTIVSGWRPVLISVLLGLALLGGGYLLWRL